MKLTTPKRIAVRTALVTGTTLATVLGAQALVSLDEAALSQSTPAAVVPADLTTQSANEVFVLQPAATSSVPAAAPNIVILRHAGSQGSASQPAVQSSVTTGSTPNVAIQPPNPVQVAPPSPVVQQVAPIAAAQPAPRTRSSR